MLRRLMVSLLLIGLTAYAIGGGTMALFTDTEMSSGTFRAGTLDFRYRVSQDGGVHWGEWHNGASASFNLPRLRRGQSGRVVYQIENLGTENGLLDLSHAVVVDYENGCSRLERRVDTTCGNPGPGQGELGAALLVTIIMEGHPVYAGLLKGFSGNYEVHQAMPAGGTVQMTIDWFLPSLPHVLASADDGGLPQGGDDEEEDDDDEDGGGLHGGWPKHKRKGDIIAGDSAAVSFRFELVQE